MNWLHRLLCRHTTVHLVRRHRNTVKPEMQGKQLYVDRHDVHNFIRCRKCGAILNTDQRDERIYEQEPQP